jgi:hypothetical protein
MDMKYIEFKRDLFAAPEGWAFAHCISADVAMGIHPITGKEYGIAAEFHRRYPDMKDYLQTTYRSGLNVGRVYPYCAPSDQRMIFNLVTKTVFNSKPTYETMAQCLSTLHSHILGYNIKQLAIPMIGAGLDRLGWYRVRQLIQATFVDLDIYVAVCIKP